jgi:SAM-dependent methyltransferase
MTGYRSHGFALLRGHGLEIGALHHPAVLPDGCIVDYYDALTKEQAMVLFPEVPPDLLVDPTYLGDLDCDGLQQFADEQFDFVILSHVIEHVANPMQVLGELFRIVTYGGHVVVACPDKRFTFDQHRPLTPLCHLADEFNQKVQVVTDDHYLHFLAYVHPQVMTLPPDQRQIHVDRVRARREHAHVWDSGSFRSFVVATLSFLSEHATCVYEVPGDENHYEYFSVWRRERKTSIHSGITRAEIPAVTKHRIAALEAMLTEREQHIAGLEASIAEKNRHIAELEGLIRRIAAGRLMRLLQGARRLFG